MDAAMLKRLDSSEVRKHWRDSARTRPAPRELPPGLSPETFRRPSFKVELAGFTKILHPAALSGSATEAWFGLKTVKPAQTYKQFALTGFSVDMRSPRVVDSGNSKAWASQGGFDAWIVIGKNLSWVLPGAWSKSPAFVPLNGGTNTNIPVAPGIGPEIISAISFPAGSWVDNPMQTKTIAREFGLETYPFRNGERLDVALVVLASRITTTITNFVEGYALVELKLAEAARSTMLVP